MENSLLPYVFEDFLVRVITDEKGDLLFVAKDVALALDYAEASNPARLLAHVPDEWRGVKPIHTRSENGVQQGREVLCLAIH